MITTSSSIFIVFFSKISRINSLKTNTLQLICNAFIFVHNFNYNKCIIEQCRNEPTLILFIIPAMHVKKFNKPIVFYLRIAYIILGKTM